MLLRSHDLTKVSKIEWRDSAYCAVRMTTFRTENAVIVANQVIIALLRQCYPQWHYSKRKIIFSFYFIGGYFNWAFNDIVSGSLMWWLALGHVNIGIIFCRIANSQWCIYNTQSKSDWMFNTLSRVLHADWLVLENNEKATLVINKTYSRSSRWLYKFWIIFSSLLVIHVYVQESNPSQRLRLQIMWSWWYPVW